MGSQVQATDRQAVLPAHKLLVCGAVLLGQGELVEVQRGMTVKAENGSAVGVVAAVVMACGTRQVTHVLLGTLPPTAVYRLIPLSLIQFAGAGALWLSAASSAVAALPCYEPA